MKINYARNTRVYIYTKKQGIRMQSAYAWFHNMHGGLQIEFH